MSGHTPGPWTHVNEEGALTGRIESEYVKIAAIFGGHDMDAERTANARLIAAAPELLAACKSALEVLQADELSWAECAELSAALAKAEAQDA